ncbi:MAG TPA: response regulator transcription factor [Methylomirabilota bacterium]|nr:response regulator transcription factor [Methylomirabilota bacterium]
MSAKRTATKKKVLIVDDHPIMRQGLAQLINHEPDLVVCAEAENAGQALEAADQSHPDLAIIDISLTGRNGLELIKDLRVRHPSLRMLVMSMHDESLYAERALRAGARGYIMKQAGGRMLMEAIRRILAGQIYVSDKMSARIVESFAGQRSTAARQGVEGLTDREFEVFQLIGQGRGTRQIAEQLNLSVKTVEVHRLHIKEKLQIADAPSLVRFAVRWVESQQAG